MPTPTTLEEAKTQLISDAERERKFTSDPVGYEKDGGGPVESLPAFLARIDLEAHNEITQYALTAANTVSALPLYDTKAAFNAALAGLANGVYEVQVDESVTNSPRTRYRVTGGVATLILNLDPRFTPALAGDSLMRTLQAKLLQHLDVGDFIGASDNEKLQKAFNWLRTGVGALPGNGFYPLRCLRLDRSYTITDEIDASDIRSSGVGIDFNGFAIFASAAGKFAINFARSRNLSFKDCYIFGVQGGGTRDGIYIGSDSSNQASGGHHFYGNTRVHGFFTQFGFVSLGAEETTISRLSLRNEDTGAGSANLFCGQFPAGYTFTSAHFAAPTGKSMNGLYIEELDNRMVAAKTGGASIIIASVDAFVVRSGYSTVSCQEHVLIWDQQALRGDPAALRGIPSRKIDFGSVHFENGGDAQATPSRIFRFLGINAVDLAVQEFSWGDYAPNIGDNALGTEGLVYFDNHVGVTNYRYHGNPQDIVGKHFATPNTPTNFPDITAGEFVDTRESIDDPHLNDAWGFARLRNVNGTFRGRFSFLAKLGTGGVAQHLLATGRDGTHHLYSYQTVGGGGASITFTVPQCRIAPTGGGNRNIDSLAGSTNNSTYVGSAPGTELWLKFVYTDTNLVLRDPSVAGGNIFTGIGGGNLSINKSGICHFKRNSANTLWYLLSISYDDGTQKFYNVLA